MKTTLIRYLVTAFLFTGFPSRGDAVGRKIVVITHQGSVLTGELLSVRAKSIVLSYEVGLDDSLLARAPELASVIPDSAISSIHSEGKSHVGEGLLIGSGIGLVTGITATILMESRATHSSTLDESINYGLGGPILGTGLLVGGMLIGTIAGATSSTQDIDMGISGPINFQKLVSASRYQSDEPEFLRAVR